MKLIEHQNRKIGLVGVRVHEIKSNDDFGNDFAFGDLQLGDQEIGYQS